MPILGPRLVVAGTHSGVGKTTVATGLLAALRAAGHRPAAAKVGPDFIDPGYHALACGRPPRNLDAWLCGADAIGPLAARAAEGADVLVVEGVMGLFDGAADGTPSSTADVARLLDAPVLLVVDAGAMSGSVAAVVHGFATLDPAVRPRRRRAQPGGVRRPRGHAAGGDRSRPASRCSAPSVGTTGSSGATVTSAWSRSPRSPTPSAGPLAALAAAVAERLDLDAVVALADGGPAPGGRPGRRPSARADRCASRSPPGRAFTFTYTDTLDALRAGGAEIVPFDPLADPALPDRLDGLVVGGGFPEVHAARLAGNEPLLAAVRRAVAAGLPDLGRVRWAALAARVRSTAARWPASSPPPRA